MAIRVENVLGQGLVAPLRRLAGKDFASAEGVALVRAAILQILRTRRGELPWRPAFGAALDRYRHQSVTEEIAAEVQLAVQRNLQAYEPRVSIGTVQVERPTPDSAVLRVRVTWSVVARGSSRNIVLAGPDTTEVTI